MLSTIDLDKLIQDILGIYLIMWPEYFWIDAKGDIFWSGEVFSPSTDDKAWEVIERWISKHHGEKERDLMKAYYKIVNNHFPALSLREKRVKAFISTHL